MKDCDFHSYLVYSAIAKGAHTLLDISRKSGGIYPLELKQLLDELVLKGAIVYSQSGYELPIREKEETSEHWHARRISLPEPHPLDYDWRFSVATSRYLTELVVTETLNDGVVLLLGAPSLLAEIVQLKNPPRTTLIDKSRELVDYLSQFELPKSVNVIAHNLLQGSLWESDRKANVVVCDPPWYVEHYIAFLAQAAYSASIGATIVVSLLPMNTRPNVSQDRWEILDKAYRLGLGIQSIENDRVEYEIPEFELVSLRSAGIDTSVNWRRGDLVIFRKISHLPKEAILEVASSAYSVGSEDLDWSEILLGKHKVKLRGPFDDYLTPPELISIEENDILPTVSRRYKGRESVDIWFWDNRVFGLKGKSSFWAALHTLAGRPIPTSLEGVSEENHQRALTLLREKLVHIDIRSTQATTSQKLRQVEYELNAQGDTLSVKKLVEICRELSVNGHLAILTRPYLDKIIARKKTIESRFSKVRIPPFKVINSGDVLFLKESSGPIRAIALVSKVQFFGPLRSGEAESIMREYSLDLALEDSFKDIKRESRYVTLVHLGDVLPIQPISLTKTDRRPWIVLNYAEPNRLF